MHRFHQMWLDIEDGLFPDVYAGRLIQMMERLPLYGGALTARAQEEMNRHRPPGQVEPQPGVEVVGSSGVELLTHPAMAGLIEYVKV